MSGLEAIFAGPSVGALRWEIIVTSLLLSYALCQLLATAYEWTYSGLSYARGFIQALVLGGLATTILMLAIGDNLARGLGVLGTVALVRFRTNVRDPRDMIFVLAALVTGMASGVRSYAVAIIGVLAFTLVAFALEWAPLSRRERFDGVLRFWAPRGAANSDALRRAMSPHCDDFVLITLRDVAQGEAMEYAYQIRLRRGAEATALVDQLSTIPGLEGLSLLTQDAHTEL